MNHAKIPYGRQSIDDEDIRAVIEVLKSDWITTGPLIEKFENAFALAVDAPYAVALSSGTAALHAAMFAIGIAPGDEVIVPAMTFAATANCIVYQGGAPVFADVTPDNLLIDPEDVEKKITSKTKAIISVDYTGHPCNYDRLKTIARNKDLFLVEDACHALGADYRGRKVGSLADLTAFSFHPVKHITPGEGGMVTTGDPDMAARARIFRNHGITTDQRQRSEQGTWYYEMVELGYNYRITDFQCALGLSQLRKLPRWLARRRGIARRYDEAFKTVVGIRLLNVQPDVNHAYHLYVVRLTLDGLKANRKSIFTSLRQAGIGVNVHYIPVHLHPFYRERFGTGPGLCPVAEAAYEQIISLPIFPGMSEDDVEAVIRAVRDATDSYSG